MQLLVGTNVLPCIPPYLEIFCSMGSTPQVCVYKIAVLRRFYIVFQCSCVSHIASIYRGKKGQKYFKRNTYYIQNSGAYLTVAFVCMATCHFCVLIRRFSWENIISYTLYPEWHWLLCIYITTWDKNSYRKARRAKEITVNHYSSNLYLMKERMWMAWVINNKINQ